MSFYIGDKRFLSQKQVNDYWDKYFHDPVFKEQEDNRDTLPYEFQEK